VRLALMLSILSAASALASAACSPASVEEQTLLQFFVAARTLDSTAIGKYATIGFNPRTEGIVETFSVIAIGPEREGRKDVTIEAVVRDPRGVTTSRTMITTFQQRADRWLITALRQTPASQTSREASSVPQK
jgi:hypothetical protein